MLINKLRSRQQRTAIINISSATCYTPIPFLNVYPSTSKFMTIISKRLNKLFSEENMDVLNVVPGFVDSKLVDFQNGLYNYTIKECVVDTLASLGHDYEVTPFYMHTVVQDWTHFAYKFIRPVLRIVFNDDININEHQIDDNNEAEISESKE